MTYSKDATVYTFKIYDNNMLTDECNFNADSSNEFSFTGTIQEFGETLAYGDFYQEDILEALQEFEKDTTAKITLCGRKYDSIVFHKIED